MAKKSYLSETHEAAYQACRKAGFNMELAVRELKKAGWVISKPTLYDWMNKFSWKERAARAEAEENRAADVVADAEGRALTGLEKLQRNYDKYFDELKPGEKIDAQDVHAYKGVITAIVDIKAKTGAFKASLFLDFMRDLIDWLSKNDPETVSAIEKIFDDFVSFAKEKYGA